MNCGSALRLSGERQDNGDRLGACCSFMCKRFEEAVARGSLSVLDAETRGATMLAYMTMRRTDLLTRESILHSLGWQPAVDMQKFLVLQGLLVEAKSLIQDAQKRMLEYVREEPANPAP